ncbi:MAPK/MAK/MRK overlapping kinase isoform X8 [Cavia porcellus]
MLYMYQLCKSLDHMHRNGMFHRDVKPENILIKQDVLKLGDFGSCRSVYSRQPYTEYISTRWYRAPECLLTDGFYTSKMDMWSAGCVFYEIASLQPLFPGVNELDQISKIHDVIGTPAPKTLTKFKHVSPSCMRWWPMTRTSASLPTRPCSTPTFRSRGHPRSRPGVAAATQPSQGTWSHWVTSGRSRRATSSTCASPGLEEHPGRLWVSVVPQNSLHSLNKVEALGHEGSGAGRAGPGAPLGKAEPVGPVGRAHRDWSPFCLRKAPRRREVPARLPKLPLPAVSALPVRSSPALRALKFGGTCDKVNTQDTKPDPPLCRLPKIDQKGARY